MHRPCAGCDRMTVVPAAEEALDHLYTTCEPCAKAQVAIRAAWNGVVGTTTNSRGEVIPRYASDWQGARITRNPGKGH